MEYGIIPFMPLATRQKVSILTLRQDSIAGRVAGVTDHLEIFDKPGHLVRRLNQIATSVFIEEAKEYGLTPVQYASLLAVDFYPGIDQRRLAKTVALDRTTVSQVVQRLVGKGLMRREQRDLRSHALSLTGAGRAVIAAMRPRLDSVEEILLAPLTPDEAATFMALLSKLVDVNNRLSRAPHEFIDPRVRPGAQDPARTTAARSQDTAATAHRQKRTITGGENERTLSRPADENAGGGTRHRRGPAARAEPVLGR